MTEKRDFYVVHKSERTEQGVSLAISTSVSCDGADLSALVCLSVEELRAMREDSVKQEDGIFEAIQAAVEVWEDRAAATQRLDRALEYMLAPPVQHTANQWTTEPDGLRRISNTVYAMFCRLQEDAKWDVWKSGNPLKVKWRAEWGVFLNKPVKAGIGCIAGQERRFDSKAAAEKYLQGRIAAYAGLFKELSPPVPQEYASHFMINGLLLPGYTVEGQEPQQAKPAAADISEGGVSTSKGEKPSVLDRLATSKAQAKEQPAQENIKKLPEKER